MADRTCSDSHCERTVRARGLCNMHYERQRLGCPPKVTPPETRFWAKVDRLGPDDCWEWTGHRDPKGYGKFMVTKSSGTTTAHRYSYEMAHGPIPDGLMVRHSCDNPPCVNPAHLAVGTAQNNADDIADHGRRRTGEDHWNWKHGAYANH